MLVKKDDSTVKITIEEDMISIKVSANLNKEISDKPEEVLQSSSISALDETADNVKMHDMLKANIINNDQTMTVETKSVTDANEKLFKEIKS